MAIISRSYFVGANRIAQALATDPDKQLLGNGETIDLFIARYEREVLLKCFGYSLFKEFYIEQFDILVDGSHELKGAAETKWDELLNGLEYNVGGRAVIWRGLIYSDLVTPDPSLDQYPQSLIADYVFAQFVYQEEYRHETTGFQSNNVKNADGISGRAKWAAASNEVFEKVNGSNISTERSLFQFIQDMNAVDPTTYPSWEPTYFKRKNRFGL